MVVCGVKLYYFDPVTNTFSDLYHVKFAPKDDVHGLKAGKLCFFALKSTFSSKGS